MRAPRNARSVRNAVLLGLAAAAVTIGCGDNLTPPGLQPYQTAADTPLVCVPNLDGRIEASEIQAAIGIPVRYRVSPAGAQRAINLEGTVNAQGGRVWDFSAPASDDQQAEIAASDVIGKWYAGSFPQGQFVTPFDAGGTLEAIYSQTSDALLLHGLASTRQDDPAGVTLFVYDTPITVLQFPIELGKTWISAGQVRNGMLRGLPYAGRDTYENEVAASGEVRLPDLSFDQAFAVSTRVTVEPAVGEAQVRRQVSFFFECFGEVARFVSLAGEENPLFTTASEERLLGF
jgi:hypothetical protein